MDVTSFLNIWILILDTGCLICISIAINAHAWFFFMHVKQVGGKTEDTPRFVEVGLWQTCSQEGDATRQQQLLHHQQHWCENLHEQNLQWLLTARYLIIASCILASISVVMTIAAYWKSIFEKISMMLILSVACTMSVTLSSFYTHHKSILPDWKELQYGWSFHVGIASVLLASVAFVFKLFMCIYLRDKQLKEVKYTAHKDIL